MDHMDKLLDQDSIYVNFVKGVEKSELYKFWSQLGSIHEYSNKIRVTIPIKQVLNRYLNESD